MTTRRPMKDDYELIISPCDGYEPLIGGNDDDGPPPPKPKPKN